MKEGLWAVRLMMTLASLTPLFVLAGIRGMTAILADRWLWLVIAVLVVVPNIVVFVRIVIAKRQRQTQEITIEAATDNREHLLVYLFAVMLPLYQSAFTSYRELLGNLAVVGFVLFLFMHMNLHYMNMAFAVCGYRVFSVISHKKRMILLTKRINVTPGETIRPYRLSNTVFMEREAVT